MFYSYYLQIETKLINHLKQEAPSLSFALVRTNQ